MIRLDPYLLFDGNCAEAMTFYHSCLGGKLTITRVDDSPVSDQMPSDQHHKVLNARLHGEHFSFSASDWLHPTRVPVQGNTVCLYLNGGTYAELRECFEKLSVGGDENFIDPLQNMFYGTYGALTDQYGVRWMFQSEVSR